MFDKLEDLLVRFEEVMNELGEPGVTDNKELFQKLMKEQSELQPIVDAYKEYTYNKETIKDSISMLEEDLAEPITFKQYPKSEFWMIQMRNRINRELEEA